MKNRLVTTMIVLLTAILLVGAIAVVVLLKMNDDKNAEPSIDEVVEASVDVPELTTNLASSDYVKISFKIQTDSKKAQKELTKRDFQVRSYIIEELSEKTADDLKGKAGKRKLEDDLKAKINEVMQDGKVVKVYITSYIIS